MSTLTLWVVIAVCTYTTGYQETSRFLFTDKAEAISFALPEPGSLGEKCYLDVYEANLQLVKPEPAPEAEMPVAAPEEPVQ